MKNNEHIGYRPTWAEVDLGNLAYNFNLVKKMLAQNVKVMVCVKADAYGHGLVPVAKKLSALGVDYFGVASIDEGIKLRKSGINKPILVLGLILKKEIRPLLRHKLTITLCDKELAFALNREACALKQAVNAHVKIDTGMGRIGVFAKEAVEFVRDIGNFKFINIEGIFTHFAFADANKEFTLHQISLFERIISGLKNLGIHIPFIHAANSMGVIDYAKSHFNMVRPGLVIYGLYPKQGLKIKLKPLLSLKTRIIYSKRVPRRYGISYGHIYITKKDTTIVTLPIGYGDGYPRNLSNLASVLIKGRRFKISGRICMDQLMVNVGNTPVKIGDEAVLIGAQGKNRIGAEELAGFAGTIPYEIVCGLGSRIPRLYID